ncbi:MAG: UDP-3-O-(3-hydroxymyristoyl)glucosamine N-acyltransferase [Pseudomonadota bacterium]
MAVDFSFHTPANRLTLGGFIGSSDVELPDNFAPDAEITALCQPDEAIAGGIVFVEKLKGKDTFAGIADYLAVLCRPKDAEALRDMGAPVVTTHNPREAFQDALIAYFPESLGNSPLFDTQLPDVDKLPNGAIVAKTAVIEENVDFGANVVIGDNVQIGRGTRIGPNTVIARRCKIGRDCDIGDNISIQYSLIGDAVVLSPGVRIGQEGFGFVPRSDGLRKIPQLGRVVLQDQVELGANSAVDRGTLTDTSIGQGTKIDNLVQVAHNVQIGVSTVIAGHAGLAGSAKVGNFCMLGGRVSVGDHVQIGDGAQVAGASSLISDIPAGERWAGSPAVPMHQAYRQYAALLRLTTASKKKEK